MRIKVATYALKDLLASLHSSGITEVTLTKEDNDLYVVINTQDLYPKQKDCCYETRLR